MARKNKTKTAMECQVEEFEAVFEDIVQDYFCDVDMDKVEEYFSNPALGEAICNVLDSQDEGEENGD